MKFILGRKLNMTQVFRADGEVVPVTRVVAGPCVVTQVKTKQADGTNAVQIGFGVQKLFRLNKAEKGHLKGISVQDNAGLTVSDLREVKVEPTTDLKRGEVFTAKIFTPGEKVAVIGQAKGKGFQGVVRRHHFKGGPASHGHKDNLRMPGSIGSTAPQRVFKGLRMAGHMGTQQVTVKNLEIVEVHPDKNEILVKGAVPGARNDLLLLYTGEGKIEIEKPAAVDAAVVTEAVAALVEDVPAATEEAK